MENTPDQARSSESIDAKVIVGMLWVVSLAATGILGFYIGQNAIPQKMKSDKEVLGSLSNQITPQPTQNAEVTPAASSQSSCEKTGYAQKWDYLASYTIKEDDTLQTIAKSELGDESRVNEILQINGVGPLVVGSTLYLPPPEIPKSSGHLKQVNGKLTEKTSSMWHLNFNDNEEGIGILIPTYWFKNIPDKNSYTVGDCLTILLDDGNTVFSVARQ